MLSDMRLDHGSCDSLAKTNCDNTPDNGGDEHVNSSSYRVVKHVEHTNEKFLRIKILVVKSIYITCKKH